ncbi:MAG: hypothetical protein IJ489_04105 [Clostridia bacterium]|nr:hypothetical protein [Clostridia bacterium]
MKKRIFSILLTFLLVFALTPSAFAANDIELDNKNTTEIIYLDNGSYITITLITQDISPLSLESTNSTSFIKTGNKVVTCNDKNGNLEWEYTLFAEFSVVEGVSATCTSATYTHAIYNNDWSFSNGNATKSGNTAYGTGTFKEKFLFVTIHTANIDISISCDVYGNLS